MHRRITVGSEVKEVRQRLKLPFPFTQSQVSAEYSVGAGKLTITLKKAGGAGAAAQTAPGEPFDVANFRVPANPNADTEKVSVQAAQAGVRLYCLLLSRK